MVNSKVVAVVLGAVLAACLPFGATGPAKAGAIAATGEAVAALPDNIQPAPQPRGRAYLFRGALGPIFSRGMDRLSKELQQAGIDADVYEFTICRFIAARAISDYHESPAPIILIGHSMGGYCSIIFSQMLEAEKIPVSLVVTIDPAHVTPNVPLNVERFINIFLSKDVLGGGDVKPQSGYRGHYASFDLSEHDEVSHITIDKMDDVHQQLIAKIVQLATTPSKDEGEPVPLRYVVPPNTAIELWDSGTAVFVRQDDTLQNIAQLFHVPLWSLLQVNRGADKTRLVQGERIVVPRHLLPLTAMSGSSSFHR
jgi:predicted alpha/beta-hydrolase family hydrolase